MPRVPFGTSGDAVEGFEGDCSSDNNRRIPHHPPLKECVVLMMTFSLLTLSTRPHGTHPSADAAAGLRDVVVHAEGHVP